MDAINTVVATFNPKHAAPKLGRASGAVVTIKRNHELKHAAVAERPPSTQLRKVVFGGSYQ
jgi:hypothetical protein